MMITINVKHFAFFLSFILFASFSFSAYSSTIDTNRIWGVTVDDISSLSIVNTALTRHCKKMTARVVFDEWTPATYYTAACSTLHQGSFIMGELCDSYYTGQYSYAQYIAKVNEYYNALGNNVDIWEIGNEVNGEWCGNTDSVVAKITEAYQIIKGHGKKTEMTLYYNWNCWANPQNEMFRWVLANIDQRMRYGLDYVLVSYYEDDCNNYQPNWQKVFDSLHVLFPNSKIGMGECGTSNSSQKASYITRYYTMNITTPNYIGGYFWWYYREDCVPYTTSLWTTIDNAILTISNAPLARMQHHDFKVSAFPNPFNPTTKISYNIKNKSFVNMKVYDIVGKEVGTLVSEIVDMGEHTVRFDGSNLSSGMYFVKVEADGESNVQKIVLVK